MRLQSCNHFLCLKLVILRCSLSSEGRGGFARGRQLGRFSCYSSHISVSRISIAKLIVHRPLNMDPTLNIEIPFVLPGRKEVLDLKKVWPKEARETRPLQEVINSLRKHCPDINVHISVSEEQPTRDTGWHLFPSPLHNGDIFTIDEEGIRQERLGLSNSTTTSMYPTRHHVQRLARLHIRSNFHLHRPINPT
jgi:hypothetical protein